MKRRTATWIATVAIILATVPSVVRIRIVQTSVRPTVICHEGECFVFVYESYFGWDRNIFGHLGGVLRAIIAGPDPPTDKAERERVTTITAAGLQQRSFRGYWFPLSVYANTIFGGGKEAGIWTGSNFRPETPQELENRVAAANRHETIYHDYPDRDGWSCKTLRPGQPILHQLNGESITISMQEEPAEQERIQLQRGNGAPITIWTVNAAQKTMTKTQYEELFAPK